MFRLNRLRLEIKTIEQPNVDSVFGFDIPFENGLNIVAGHNSKGKTTISSCIYFGLGMEELLGGQNDKALDKSLKSSFNIFNPNAPTKKVNTYTILTSKVLLEVSNSIGNTVTIQRFINQGPKDQADEDKSKFATIFDSPLSSISSLTKTKTLYLRARNNNENEYGFYNWLAEFIGLNLPTVTNLSKKNGYSPLYLQTIFPSLFIEQTKGWSDFFATTPYFGIPKVKEKVVEFILALNELEVSTEKDKITKEKKDLESAWKSIYSKIELLAAESDGILKDIPVAITEDKKSLSISNVLIQEGKDSLPVPLGILIEQKNTLLNSLRVLPILKVGDNKMHLKEKIEEKKKEYKALLNKLREFDIKFDLQKNQLQTLERHEKDILKELSKHKGIQKIFNQSLVKEEVYNRCPTCTQDVSVDLMSTNNIHIEKLSLDENVAYLEGQRKLIQSSLESLSKVVKEKEILRKYYIIQQRDLEDEIKVISNELIADDREFSEFDALSRVRLEKQISDYTYLNSKFIQYVSSLGELADRFFNLLQDEEKLERNYEEDKAKLDRFEKTYKNKYLRKFKYDSNPLWNISIQLKDPFRYFPVYKFHQDDNQPQSIRVNSSASDFVRNLWAYSIALLQEGDNHPGLVIFDEPGQHRIDSESLKALFESSAEIRDKQIIIFTSVDKQLSDDDKIDLTILLKDLVEEQDYFIYKLDEVGKSIHLLEN
ncbi:hypothetical protein [Pontibacter litorisediminis]|uniref:hypothetical protein n=1 Tax=Pontibacter litorisediminis TaxID=1846260 RepID=UPI0023EDF41E|nr:hypothetical protein [Pontibacter litorisediminis]